MSSVCKEGIPNIKEEIIELIYEIFGLNTNERNNLRECFNSKAELKLDKNNIVCVFKGACSISFFFLIFRIDDRLNIEESPIMKLNSLLEDLFQISLSNDKESILLKW